MGDFLRNRFRVFGKDLYIAGPYSFMRKSGAIGKFQFFAVGSIAIIFSLMVLTIADHVLTPSTYENGFGFSVNENITNEFNITVNNTDLFTINNITNVTFSIPDTFVFVAGTNITGANEVDSLFSNTTTNITWANGTLGYLINGSIVGSGNDSFFTFNYTTTIPGSYNITVTTVSAQGVNITAQNISVEVNDTTAPFSLNYTGASPATTANLSQDNIIVNITVNDTDGAFAGTLDTVRYYIHYPNGTEFNNTNTTTNSDSIKFTGLINGTWFINISANDTAGNENYTVATSRIVVIDTEAPSASASCSPSSVTQGATVTCTCSGTDGFSGINSTATTAGSTPSTADTGTYSYGCSVTDFAGNSDSSTVEYSVSGDSGGSGGGSDDDYWTGSTEDVSDTDFAAGYTSNVAPKSQLKVSVNNEDHFVGVVSLTATTVKINVSSNPQQATFSVGDTRKFDVNSDNFYDLQVTLNSINLGGNTASISILSIHEVVTEESIAEEEELEEEALDAESSSEGISWVWWIVGLTVLIIILFVIVYLRRSE